MTASRQAGLNDAAHYSRIASPLERSGRRVSELTTPTTMMRCPLLRFGKGTYDAAEGGRFEMSLKPIEQRDAGNVKHSHPHSAVLRKRILAALAVLLMVLMFTLHNYHRSRDLQNAVDWRWFWAGETFIAAWLLFVVVHLLRRKGP